MKNKTVNTADVAFIGNQAITDIVNNARSLWASGQDNRLKLGEKFSQLYHAVERYKKSAKTRLTYAGAVTKTGVPRGTAERYREMWEVKNEYSIPADAFLVLCEEGSNLATVKAKLGEAFKGAISPLLPRIQSLDTTNAKAVKDLAEDISKLIPEPMGEEDLAELQGNLSDLVGKLPKAKSREESVDLAAAINQTTEQIGALYLARMRALVNALAPFLDWSPEEVRNYLKAFEEQPLSQRTQLYEEATKFAKTTATGLAITQKAA